MKKFISKFIRTAKKFAIAGVALPLLTLSVHATALSNITAYVGKTSAILVSGVQGTNGYSGSMNLWAVWGTNSPTVAYALTNGAGGTVFVTSTNYNVAVGTSSQWTIGGLNECSNYIAIIVGYEPGAPSNVASAYLPFTNSCPIGVTAGNLATNAPVNLNSVTIAGTNYTLGTILISTNGTMTANKTNRVLVLVPTGVNP